MSRTSVTTHDLFLRLGATTRLRSARADAVFRRLRLEKPEDDKDSVQTPLADAPAGAKDAKTSSVNPNGLRTSEA
jgi:hypothetical protein